jgi:hypothetical protein
VTTLILKNFSGIRPRVPESLLPEANATIAQNCDFAYGELRNTKGGYLVNSMSNSPTSIYTDDGLTFYTWTNDVNAVRSPLAKDTYSRMYYTGDSGFKVADRTGTRLSGGVPSSSYLVGVPKPINAPTLTTLLPVIDSTTTTYYYRFHWEYGGTKYQEQFIPVTQTDTNNWDLLAPEKDTDTPEQAVGVLRVTGIHTADGTQTFDLYSNNSSYKSTGGLYSLDAVSTGGLYFHAALTVAIQESDKESRAYVYTYVNNYDEEGPPSAPQEVTTAPTIGATVSVVLDSISGYVPIKEIRVYRTATGSTIADYFYSGSITVSGQSSGTFTYSDTNGAALLNEPLTSTYYYPPSQSLVGLMTLPNGILCAWTGNELWFSEAYKPWAWPPSYIKPLTHAIVNGVAFGSGAIITTVTNPYIISGVSPDSMTASRLNVDQAGVSKWSIAAANGTVIFASHDGLVTINGATGSLASSEQFFTREVWRTKYASGLSSMRFAVWDGRLVVYSGSAAFTPFMIRFDEADGTLTDLPNYSASCSFTSPLSDQLYYASGTGVYQFNGGSDQSASWQSREIVIPTPTNFGFAQAVVTGSWDIKFYADGVLKLTKSVTEGTTNFRLPSGFKSQRWKIAVTGSGRFRELRVANTAAELART